MATFGGSSYPNPTKMVTFKTSDDRQVKMPVEIARMCGVVRDLYDRDSPDVDNAHPLPLYNVRSGIFVNIVLASETLLELRPIREAVEAVEKERQNFFDQLSDKTIVDLVKAADYLEIKEVLDFVMSIVRKRFGLGDDKGVEFVYEAKAEAASAIKPTIAIYGGSSDPNPTTMATFITSSPTMATFGGSSYPNPTKMVTFKTSDGKQVEVPVEIAMVSGVVKAFFDGNLDRPKVENTVWPLPIVSSHVLDIVVYACKKLLELRPKYDAMEKERQKFDVQFFGQQTDETIVEQVDAAHYLQIDELLNFVMPSFRKRQKQRRGIRLYG